MSHHILTHTPPDYDAAINAHYDARDRAQELLRKAQTEREAQIANFWLRSAMREIETWQARKDEATR